jgi:hypothetical protein
MAKRNVVNFRIVNIPDDNTFEQLEKQGKVDPNAMYVSPDTSLKEKHITNCITEIPQDVKLEYSGNTITLKSGSKTYIPNGSGVFANNVYTQDKSVSFATGLNGSFIIFAGQGPNSNIFGQRDNCFYSGSPAPTFSTNVVVWYDTSANLIKFSNNGGSTWFSENYSFPLAKVTVANGEITSIDQVFNGIGYIGRTIFVTPGVKCLIPNGFNSDGTLKNLTGTITQTQTLTVSGNSTYAIRMHNDYLTAGVIVYDRKTNQNYNQTISPENARNDAVIGSITTTSSGGVVSFEPKFAFRAVDYSDFVAQNNAFDSELQNTKTDLANTKTDLANTKSTLATATATLQTNIDNVAAIFGKIYPVGAIYIGTQSTCPMSIAIPNSEWSLVSAGRALWTGNGSNANTTIAAGLPNIKGTATNLVWGGPEDQRKTTGALKYNGELRIGNYSATAGSGANFGNYGLEVDANLSSSIYRDDVDTVQPPAYVVNVWRRTK